MTDCNFSFLSQGSNTETEALNNKITWIEATEVCIPEEYLEEDKRLKHGTLQINDKTHLLYITPKSLVQIIKDLPDTENLVRAEANNSDLVTGIYEGGLKIWECTIDLINFVINQEISFKGKRILDLGCGSGLVGIYALKNGGELFFQDYNTEVVQYVTIKNAFLNNGDFIKPGNQSPKFFSGDWSSFVNLLEKSYDEKQRTFDYIFTAETIYNPNNYSKLADVFSKCLKPDGCVFLAAKTYYFGIGGGVRQFEKYLLDTHKFEVSTVWKSTEGLSKEILQIKLKV